jgi:cation transporter-like permease
MSSVLIAVESVLNSTVLILVAVRVSRSSNDGGLDPDRPSYPPGLTLGDPVEVRRAMGAVRSFRQTRARIGAARGLGSLAERC